MLNYFPSSKHSYIKQFHGETQNSQFFSKLSTNALEVGVSVQFLVLSVKLLVQHMTICIFLVTWETSTTVEPYQTQTVDCPTAVGR